MFRLFPVAQPVSGDTTKKSLLFSLIASAALAVLATTPTPAQNNAKLKVGLMLPYTGTFAALGTVIEN